MGQVIIFSFLSGFELVKLANFTSSMNLQYLSD